MTDHIAMPRPPQSSEQANAVDIWPITLGKWATFLVLSGWLLFAHGCHGDEDNELFARLVAAGADALSTQKDR
jgi:hypothetical protein